MNPVGSFGTPAAVTRSGLRKKRRGSPGRVSGAEKGVYDVFCRREGFRNGRFAAQTTHDPGLREKAFFE
jgi:hypothetical protein